MIKNMLTRYWSTTKGPHPDDLFQVTFDLAVDGMAVVEPDGRYIVVNQRVTELTGYANEELMGMNCKEIVVPEYVEGTRLNTNVPSDDVPSDGSIVTNECCILRKDGTTLPAEVFRRRLPNGRILETLRDVSKRKEAEATLRRSESRYRALVESQIDLVSRYRGDTILTFVNDAYCKFFGKSREELIGKTFMFMVAPEFHDLVAKETQELAKNPTALIVGEYINFTHQGDERHIQWIVHSITDDSGQVLELQAVGRDVTQLKQTQEALHQANIVVESSPVVLFRWKAARGWPVEYVSKNIIQFGYSVDELQTGRFAFIDMVHPDDQVRFTQEVREYSAKGTERFQREYRILTKTGEVRWIDARTVIQRDADGLVLGYQGILIDITKRKAAEEERKRLQNQLYQVQKMESVGRLAGGVAHDFNNMLTAILGHTEIALLKLNHSDPVYDALSIVEDCALRSADIVRQLMAFARQQTISPKVLDMNDTVASMLKMLRRLIGEDIEFTWRPGAGLWPIKIDPSQIDQLLVNLCINARDAIENIGRITIKSDNTVLDDSFCAENPGSLPGKYVMLTVSDDGCGMDQETRSLIFEPFFTTKEVGKGTGLGLATVYGIVKQNEGYVSVASEQNKGSTFRIYLPRCDENLAEDHSEKHFEFPKTFGETILLVEDEKMILDTSKTMLETLGYRVLAAASPSEAIEYAKTNEIGLLLTDVVMPEMNGRDLARHLADIHINLKCLFLSGYAADGMANRGQPDSTMHFLQKPFTMNALATKLREVLD
jgi:two-component system, cell cycle sensor histidine kinase and response regulator CckA